MNDSLVEFMEHIEFVRQWVESYQEDRRIVPERPKSPDTTPEQWEAIIKLEGIASAMITQLLLGFTNEARAQGINEVEAWESLKRLSKMLDCISESVKKGTILAESLHNMSTQGKPH